MISDDDIKMCASALVTMLGEDAPIEAAMRVDAMLDKGDLDGYAVWRRGLRAAEALVPKRALTLAQELLTRGVQAIKEDWPG